MTLRTALAELFRPPADRASSKAATGVGVTMLSNGTPLVDLSRSPQKRMREAQAAYWSNFAVRRAETVVTDATVGRPWHLETDADDEITSGPIFELIDKPQAFLPIPGRKLTRRGLWSRTIRHMGLCNVAYWYLDRADRNGFPLGIMYVNPARVWPVEANGNLIGWVIDATGTSYDGRPLGGLPLPVEELLQFTLTEPDVGFLGSGLVEAVWAKVQILSLADRHFGDVLSSGGRLQGIVAPKEGALNPDQFKALERSFRNITEDPQAAKRTIISEGPLDFTETGNTPNELNELDISKATATDIATTWGVPLSQMAMAVAAGLNSGETKGYDEAVLMQGAVHARVVSFKETVQSLIERAGTGQTLEIEEPSFDDESPAYELAAKAERVPLTRNERRAIIGLDPLPDYGPDEEPLGLAIDLPIGISVVGQGPEENGKFDNAPVISPEPVLPTFGTPAAPVAPFPLPTKASLRKPIEALRRKIDEAQIPLIAAAVEGVFAAQRAEIARRIRERGDHIEAAPKDDGAWWNAGKWDRRLADALRPFVGRISTQVAVKVASIFEAGKAVSFTDQIAAKVLRTSAARVTRINETTRDAVREAIRQGIAQGLTAQEIATLVENLTGFDPARAELIARTETMAAYNSAALESYTEFGVEMVEPIDGDEDDECRERLKRGARTIAEAMADEDHPNGTLDWVPVIEAPAKAALTIEEVLAAVRAQLPPSVSITSAAPAPIVEFDYGMDGKIVRMREVRAG